MKTRWSHFPSDGDTVNPLSKESLANQRQGLGSALPLSLAELALSPSSRAVGAPISRRNDKVFHGSHGMGPLASSSEMSCVSSEAPPQTYGGEPTEAPIPCRNLTEAFEEVVRVEPATDAPARTPAAKPTDSTGDDEVSKDKGEVSPAGVADLPIVTPTSDTGTHGSDGPAQIQSGSSESPVTPTAEAADEDALPTFFLHEDLKRELSQPLVNRVAFYGVIRDINQEAVSMASNDHSSFAKTETGEEDEHLSPLVVAAHGQPSGPEPSEDSTEAMVDAALIDEERWLLAAIESRVNADEPRSCPPTFSEAMGEREYENPLSSLQTSRTQLWKPSRSWWEAKSGKNPWIEPKSHNKRWRYLWPLIHYHKFLAKCIKKLKRNGVDVKSSVSPVAVFLREEVCAVSDHLASVSLFTSEEWMAVLEHFHGWTDPDSKAEARLRKLVSKQKLRPLADQGDVDSPLLRSQIDEQFLKAMASARDQMINGANLQERKNAKDGKAGVVRSLHTMSAEGRPSRKHPTSQATPPLPQYINAKSPPNGQKPRRKGGKPAPKPHPGYPNSGGNWSANGWRHPQYGDDTSALSGSFSTMSENVYPQHFNGHGEYGPYQGAPGYYPLPHPQYAQTSPGSNAAEYYYYTHGAPYHPEGMAYPMAEHYFADQALAASPGFQAHPSMGDPNLAVYGAMTVQQSNPVETPQYGPPPGYASAAASGGEVPGTPYEFSPNMAAMDPQFSGQHSLPGDPSSYNFSPHGAQPGQGSPYFDHINPLANLFTPQGKPSPATPKREQDSAAGTSEPKSDSKSDEKTDSFTAPSVNVEFAKNAKPLLINHPSQYYHYGQAIEGYVPPSPATQFMMPPQANSQAAAYFARNNGHASPQRMLGRNMRNTLAPVASTDSEKNEKDASPADKEEKKSEASESTHVTPPPAVRKVTNPRDRESPSTVQTAAESESINEAAA